MDIINNYFELQATTNPNKIAVSIGGAQITYGMLHHKSNHLATQLQNIGLKPDTLIAICLERSIDQIIAMLSILKAGGAYVPLDPNQPPERLKTILNNSECSILITRKTYVNKTFKQYTGKIVVLNKRRKNIKTQPHNLHTSIKPNNLAYVIYTSGSTGAPKGVLIEHQSVVNYCQWLQQYANITPDLRIDGSANYCFDMAVTTTIAPLMLGATIIMCNDDVKKNPHIYLHYLQTNKINCIKITPSYFKELIREITASYIPLPDLQTIILGGENLQVADCRTWLKYYPQHTLYNEYGPTETTVAVTQQKITKHNIQLFQTYVPIGTPCNNITCSILDENMHPVSQNNSGELYISGICLARGYNNQPDLTSANFIKHNNNHLYKTGDLCRYLPDGSIECLGRIDNQIKIRGHRIELGEIEYHLKQHPQIKDAILYAYQSPSLNTEIIAYYILKDRRHKLSYKKLRTHLAKNVPDYMLPKAFVAINSFPLTANGKLDYKQLPNPTIDANYKAPTTNIEKKLLKIWSDELKIDSIGIYDNFYELGGHSLNSARIIQNIKLIFKKDINYKEFHHAANIANLSSIIKQKPRNKNKLISHKIDLKKIPLSDFQLLLWLSKTFIPKARKLNLIAVKRFEGEINLHHLNQAFADVLNKHPILSMRIATFYPAHIAQNIQKTSITETDLRGLESSQIEKILLNSTIQLTQYYPWPKNQPLARIRLFYLTDNSAEIQFCIPHLIADEISLNIFWQDLSNYYLEHQNLQKQTKKEIAHNIAFQTYIFEEQQHMQQNLQKDYLFWKSYLQNVSFLRIPQQYIVPNMQKHNLAYSTYYSFPASLLKQLEELCIENHLGLDHILCASISVMLQNTFQQQNNNILLNIVKSTRNNQKYDEAIGCFIKIDPISVEVPDDKNILTIAQQINQSMLQISNYTYTSNILKLACATNAESNLKHKMIKVLINTYNNVLKILALNYQSLPFSLNLNSYKFSNTFLIYINIWNNFIEKNQRTNLFNLKSQDLPVYKSDISQLDNLIDLSFLRDENQKDIYLVISSNLFPETRMQMAHEVMRLLHEISDKELRHAELL